MVEADPRSVLPALVQARSSSLLRTAHLLTGDRVRAERLLHDALAEVRRRHKRIDPFEAEWLVRTAMAKLARCTLEDPFLEADIEVEVPDEWRADLTAELHAPPPPPRDWSVVAVVAAALVGVLTLSLVLNRGGGSPPNTSALSFGNAWVLDQMREGGPTTVDATAHSLDEIADSWGRSVGADLALARATDACDGVYALRRAKEPRLVRSWCATRLLSLSPDGQSVLISGSDSRSSVPRDLRPAGMIDVRSGNRTSFVELTDLDQYDGDDLVGFAWEDNRTVVLAYLVDRPHIRVVRCTLGDFDCEVAGDTPSGFATSASR